jgi:hypothetical protein
MTHLYRFFPSESGDLGNISPYLESNCTSAGRVPAETETASFFGLFGRYRVFYSCRNIPPDGPPLSVFQNLILRFNFPDENDEMYENPLGLGDIHRRAGKYTGRLPRVT